MMEFRTVISSGQEVLFVGREAGNSQPPEAWQATGRWKVSMSAVDAYLTGKLAGRAFGRSVSRFVFCFEIADFEQWERFFKATSDYVSYRPKSGEIWSVGQIRWSDVKDLPPLEQLRALRAAIQTAIERIGTSKRKPKDFDYRAFASTIKSLLEQAPEELLLATPAT